MRISNSFPYPPTIILNLLITGHCQSKRRNRGTPFWKVKSRWIWQSSDSVAAGEDVFRKIHGLLTISVCSSVSSYRRTSLCFLCHRRAREVRFSFFSNNFDFFVWSLRLCWFSGSCWNWLSICPIFSFFVP